MGRPDPSADLAAVESELTATMAAMQRHAQAFVAPCSTFLADWIERDVKYSVTHNPKITLAIGEAGVGSIKQKVGRSVATLAAAIVEDVSRSGFWAHETPSTMESFKRSRNSIDDYRHDYYRRGIPADSRCLRYSDEHEIGRNVSRLLGRLVGPTGQILSEHGYIVQHKQSFGYSIYSREGYNISHEYATFYHNATASPVGVDRFDHLTGRRCHDFTLFPGHWYHVGVGDMSFISELYQGVRDLAGVLRNYQQAAASYCKLLDRKSSLESKQRLFDAEQLYDRAKDLYDSA